MTTNEPTEKNVSELEGRTRRALEEYMTVLPEEETGLCRVYTESGEEYVVDAEVLTDDEETDEECEECAGLDGDLPCFECWMRERGFEVEGSA